MSTRAVPVGPINRRPRALGGPLAGGRFRAHLVAVVVGVALGSCGGGSSSGPTDPGTPTPPPGIHSLTATVYYDFLRNNVIDPAENVRFEGVELQVGGGSGRTGSNGEALVQGISAGTHQVVIEPSTLPPFFVAGSDAPVNVPQETEVLVPVTLPIGQNQPFKYLCSGDSITKGTGSSDEMGYRSILQPMLAGLYDTAIDMKYRGRGGGFSSEGVARTERDLSLVQPAYILIGWGTNDYNQCGAPSTCDTVPNLRSMVQMAKAARTMPCVATIIPANEADANTAPGRNDWIEEMNGMIRAMAAEEGALVADLHAAFVAAGSPPGFFVDHVHPSPAGYEVIAQTWFDALTQPRGLNPAAAYVRTGAP